jgi:hypothetical protein
MLMVWWTALKYGSEKWRMVTGEEKAPVTRSPAVHKAI